MGKTLTHLDAQGRARMVDVGPKAVTSRQATAEAYVTLLPATIRAIKRGRIAKGEVLATARIAGILAAKRVAELIPLCHSLALDSVTVDFEFPKAKSMSRLRILSTATICAKTGVEMEALMAVSVAALTVYDMCKAVDKSMVIDGVRLISKTGGKSDYLA